MNISEEIEKLEKLRADGVMSDDEFALAKAKLITGADAPATTSSTSINIDLNENQWSMFIHLGLLLPGLGFVVSIVLWQLKKGESAVIDQHGKNVTNWIISAFIYAIISAVLVVIVIGAFLLPAIGICTLVFAIIGALKANDGEIWKYPMTIQFFK